MRSLTITKGDFPIADAMVSDSAYDDYCAMVAGGMERKDAAIKVMLGRTKGKIQCPEGYDAPPTKRHYY